MSPTSEGMAVGMASPLESNQTRLTNHSNAKRRLEGPPDLSTIYGLFTG